MSPNQNLAVAKLIELNISFSDHIQHENVRGRRPDEWVDCYIDEIDVLLRIIAPKAAKLRDSLHIKQLQPVEMIGTAGIVVDPSWKRPRELETE